MFKEKFLLIKILIIIIVAFTTLFANDNRPTTMWEVNDVNSWAAARNGISNGGDDKIHIINVSANVSIPPIIAPVFTNTYTFGNVKNVTVILQGTDTMTISDVGHLLVIGHEQTVVIKDLTMQGRNNTGALIYVLHSTLRMEGNAKITGNHATSTNTTLHAGAVQLMGGTLIMQDNAVVSGNSVTAISEAHGGGIYSGPGGGNVIMRDNARVSDNIARISGFSVRAARVRDLGAYGGGVYGVLTMEGGIISNNTADGGEHGAANGGGVFGTVIMHDGLITENSAIAQSNAKGGGVSGNFTMHGGTISNNTVSAINTSSNLVVRAQGGGVNGGNVVIHDGTISGNTVVGGIPRTWSSDVYAVGGGVCAGSFTMHDGIISGNSVRAFNDVRRPGKIFSTGGGVYTVSFTKTGGIVYGNDAPEERGNVAIGGKGHAVYLDWGRHERWRNATAEPNDVSNAVGHNINDDDGGFWPNETDITYDVVYELTPPTVSLTFTFSEDPGDLHANHITFCDNVSKENAVVSGSGNTRTLSPITVSGNGIINVSILSKYRVETGAKRIMLRPNAPTGVTATPSAYTVTLNWNPAFLATGYRIYRSTSASGNYTIVDSTTSTSYTDIRLAEARTYHYRATAYNAAGESADSAQVSATTLRADANRVISASSNTVVIEWTRDAMKNVAISVANNALSAIEFAIELLLSLTDRLPLPNHSYSYVIYRDGVFLREIEIPERLTVTGVPPRLDLVQDNRLLNHFFVDTGLNPNTTYNYRVDIRIYLNYGILNTVMRDSTIMTRSATTLSD